MYIVLQMNHLDVPGRNLRKVGIVWFVSKKEIRKVCDCVVRTPPYNSLQRFDN